MATSPWRHSRRYTSAKFKPYVIALGQVALAWNDLQESLAELFWTTMNNDIPQPGDAFDYQALHVWHSIKSDRSQREMLKAAVDSSSPKWSRTEFRKDVKWLLKEATKIEDARNDAVHSPLIAVDNSFYNLVFKKKEPVAPAWNSFNPRAAKLRKKENLLNEFRYCRDASIVISDFARDVHRALINPQLPWPDRPRLPSRTKKSVPRDQPRQQSREQYPHQPRASPA